MKRKLAVSLAVALAFSAVPLARAGVAGAQAGPYRYVHLCGVRALGFAHCNSIIRLSTLQNAQSSSATGYAPADLQSAYNLPSTTAGSGQTVAIVDAFDNPRAEVDLAVYRAHFGLPACTTANGCFRKVNQVGGTTYPAVDPSGGWEGEESLDVDMVSAICPNCKILLVEATSSSNKNLGIAVDEAAKLGANAISNSYGGSESPLDRYYDYLFYYHPGIVVTASSGDSGYGASYPASSPFVVAVGGTSLAKSHNGSDWSEIAWSGGGSGCSAYEPKPSWQTDPGCSRRTVADVSAVADPNTGVAVYDTFPMPGSQPGWFVFGGTSVSSPIIASVYALAGNGATLPSPAAQLYSHAGDLNDIVEGYNNGNSVPGCTFPSYLCTAGPAYDGPTGLGTPNGLGAF